MLLFPSQLPYSMLIPATPFFKLIPGRWHHSKHAVVQELKTYSRSWSLSLICYLNRPLCRDRKASSRLAIHLRFCWDHRWPLRMTRWQRHQPSTITMVAEASIGPSNITLHTYLGQGGSEQHQFSDTLRSKRPLPRKWSFTASGLTDDGVIQADTHASNHNIIDEPDKAT